MSDGLQFLCRVYGLLLTLYPRRYQKEYGDELQAVFNLSLDDALKKGKLEATNVMLRELIGLPTAILYEHLRKPRYSLVAQPSIFAKGIYMETITRIRWADEDSWMATLANLLPLWLLSFAIAHPISIESAITAFYLAIAVSIVLLWKGWLTFDLLLYSLFPFIFLFIFEEIHTSYKTPFILLCALSLSAGLVSAQRSSSLTVRWLILLLAAFATWTFASHAGQSYWQMVNETPWWVLFFSL